MTVFVLVHAPLVGPATWEGVARELRTAGHAVVVPRLTSPFVCDSYWCRHVGEVIASVPSSNMSIVLVAHSGAGPLLPAMENRLGDRVVARVFVDAMVPCPLRSRFQAFGAEAVAAVRSSARNGCWPRWPDAVMARQIPNPAHRARVVGEMQPLPLAVYQETLPADTISAHVKCGYLRFSEPYANEAQSAAAQGCRSPRHGAHGLPPGRFSPPRDQVRRRAPRPSSQ